MSDIETVRRLVLQFLAKNPSFGSKPNDGAHDIVLYVQSKTGSSTDTDESKIHEVIWDLIVQRVLTVKSGGSYHWGLLRLTEFGREVVTGQSWSPYDPDGYLKELARQAPKIHKLCKLYAVEALNCFRAGCYLGTSVMLGASSEAAMDYVFHALARAMRANGNLSEVDTYEKKIAKEPSIYKRFESFKRPFAGVRPKVPNVLKDDLDGQLEGVFQLIRYYRNESGHPTQTQVERMAAFRNMVLFVPYCRRIEQLSEWLEAHAGELA